MISRPVKILILIHICISAAGLLLHLSLHPMGKSLFFLWAAPMSAMSLVVIPFLYYRPSTVAWGFLFNAMAVFLGTVGMAYSFLLNLERPVDMYHVFFASSVPGILALWMKLLIGYRILIEMQHHTISKSRRGCIE